MPDLRRARALGDAILDMTFRIQVAERAFAWAPAGPERDRCARVCQRRDRAMQRLVNALVDAR